MSSAGPLLNLLGDENTDDVLRHRLILAALCLPEIQVAARRRESLLQRNRQITSDLVNTWSAGVGDKVKDHLGRGLPGLAEAGIVGCDTPFLSWLVTMFYDDEFSIWAAVRVKYCGSAAATPEILAILAVGLRDPGDMVRLSMARAVGGIGLAAATPEFLTALAAGLWDPDGGVRGAMAWAVGVVGPAAATPEILTALVAGLRDPDSGVRGSMAWAVDGIGPTAVTSEILTSLAGAIESGDDGLRSSIAKNTSWLRFIKEGRRWTAHRLDDFRGTTPPGGRDEAMQTMDASRWGVLRWLRRVTTAPVRRTDG